jgi:enolase
MSVIKSVFAREILDSRGNPTVECDLKTDKGLFRASVPSGASTGSKEAVELRDEDKRYMGKGVLRAVRNVNDIISKEIVGKDLIQKDVDATLLDLDGTDNKSKLGGNALLSVSMACSKAIASEKGMELYESLGDEAQNKNFILPAPMMNVINGGKHAGVDNDVQEHMIMPIGAESFREALRMGAETYHHLQRLLKIKFGAAGIHLGDEGGFVPPMKTVQERLEIISQAIEKAGYEKDVVLTIDAASSEFYKDGRYNISGSDYSSGELVDFYSELSNTFNIVSMEDVLAEDDWEGWKEVTSKLGGRLQLVGDDLLCTNVKLIQKAIDTSAVNSVLLKINQIGTITEAISAHNLAKSVGWTTVVSHRSGSTEDTLIGDLVVGLGAGQSKFGAPARTDRNCKYNQLLRIEEILGDKARFAGREFRKVGL